MVKIDHVDNKMKIPFHWNFIYCQIFVHYVGSIVISYIALSIIIHIQELLGAVDQFSEL